mmetsp:Transcript_17527/g.41268  ORF Transcript_17527/g.41268 Transcript_17527/m.41268 type:complete len:247 (+) Transcript_17527:945-1685(+)
MLKKSMARLASRPSTPMAELSDCRLCSRHCARQRGTRAGVSCSCSCAPSPADRWMPLLPASCAWLTRTGSSSGTQTPKRPPFTLRRLMPTHPLTQSQTMTRKTLPWFNGATSSRALLSARLLRWSAMSTASRPGCHWSERDRTPPSAGRSRLKCGRRARSCVAWCRTWKAKRTQSATPSCWKRVMRSNCLRAGARTTAIPATSSDARFPLPPRPPWEHILGSTFCLRSRGLGRPAPSRVEVASRVL